MLANSDLSSGSMAFFHAYRSLANGAKDSEGRRDQSGFPQQFSVESREGNRGTSKESQAGPGKYVVLET